MAYIQTLKNIPLPATLLTFSIFFSPKLFESKAFKPTPVPTPTAIIKICMGNAIVRAWFASPTLFSHISYKYTVNYII